MAAAAVAGEVPVHKLDMEVAILGTSFIIPLIG